MTKNTPVTSFDQLATETILDIFQYLSCNDTIDAFFNINQRFNSILLQHRHVLNNFEISTRNFHFSQDPLPIIEHMIITTNDFDFSLNFFLNLKSIIISSLLPINFGLLDSLLRNEQFQKLTSFKIRSIMGDCEELERILFERIFHNDNSLEIFECSFRYNFEEMNYLTANRNIYSLSLKLNNLIDVFFLLQYTPNLKSFKLIVTSFDKQYRKLKNDQFHLSNIKLEKFDLTYEINRKNSSIDEEDCLLLINFLRQFSSSLLDLSMNLNEVSIIENQDFQFNGIFLQQQFLQFMIKLKIFHLYVKLLKNSIDVKYLLSTFENQFWYDHHWSIGIDGNYFYTLPFHFDHVNSIISNSLHQWHRIKSINLVSCGELSLNLIQQMKFNMPNLISIYLPSSYDQYSELMKEYETNSIDATLNSVTTIHCGYEFLDDLKQCFIYISPNVKRLVLSYSVLSVINFNLDKLYSQLSGSDSYREPITTDYAHLLNIEYLEMKFDGEYLNDLCKDVLDPIKKILDVFKYSRTLIFHFYHRDSSDSLDKPYTDMNKMITLLNMEKSLEKYCMKHSYNYLQLIKNEQ